MKEYKEKIIIEYIDKRIEITEINIINSANKPLNKIAHEVILAELESIKELMEMD